MLIKGVEAPDIILSSSYEKLLIYVHIRHRMILLFVHNLLTCQSKFLKALSRFEREVHAFNNKANNVMQCNGMNESYRFREFHEYQSSNGKGGECSWAVHKNSSIQNRVCM